MTTPFAKDAIWDTSSGVEMPNSDGIIKLGFADADYTKRIEPSEVIEILRNLR